MLALSFNIGKGVMVGTLRCVIEKYYPGTPDAVTLRFSDGSIITLIRGQHVEKGAGRIKFVRKESGDRIKLGFEYPRHVEIVRDNARDRKPKPKSYRSGR